MRMNAEALTNENIAHVKTHVQANQESTGIVCVEAVEYAGCTGEETCSNCHNVDRLRVVVRVGGSSCIYKSRNKL